MTIKEKIYEYLEKNFDGRLMLKVGELFYHFENNAEILPRLTSLFEKWAYENTNNEYNDPVRLFDLCLLTHSFGDICTLYYEDNSGDYCIEKPYPI